MVCRGLRGVCIRRLYKENLGIRFRNRFAVLEVEDGDDGGNSGGTTSFVSFAYGGMILKSTVFILVMESS